MKTRETVIRYLLSLKDMDVITEVDHQILLDAIDSVELSDDKSEDEMSNDYFKIFRLPSSRR